MTQYFVDQSGNYLGGFDGALPPDGSIEVPTPPQDGRQKWVNGAWATLTLVPQSVTRRQAKQALLLTTDASGATLLSKVQPAINAITDATQREMMQLEWDESQDFVRTRSTLIQMGYAIGLNDAGIDQLFIKAATL